MHNTCQIDYPDLIYEMAEEITRNFKILIPYPCLLMKWQIHHKEDTIRIATIASHRLGKHLYCETSEKCVTVDKFIRKYEYTHV